MRLLVVNVNTTESMTEAIGQRARRFAGPGTEIIALTPTFGADSCESNLDSHLVPAERRTQLYALHHGADVAGHLLRDANTFRAGFFSRVRVAKEKPQALHAAGSTMKRSPRAPADFSRCSR